jgi:hypothetical protein
MTFAASELSREEGAAPTRTHQAFASISKQLAELVYHQSSL